MSNLPTIFQQTIHKSRYARWNEEYGRREDWPETVARYCNFFHKHFLNKFDYNLGNLNDLNTPLGLAYNSILNLHVMPSMRCLMTAGPALEQEHLCGFNCSYRAIDDLRAFDEIMYALMCGCGVGFSVERQFIGQLPMIPKRLKSSSEVIVVEDNRASWANSFRLLIERLYQGNIPQWNVDKVRPAGARLKTIGGYASGPEPLVDLFKFTIHLIQQAVGRRLNSLECHDLVCKIGDIVVMGGVRRSALISLSNPSDMRMRHAKMGNWDRVTPWRALANNSACYTERPTTGAFMGEWLALYDSKSGERGIINRQAMLAKCSKIGRRIHWDDFAENDADDIIDFGGNPCFTGDTQVWTIYGPKRFDELARTGLSIPVLTQLKTGKLAFRTMKLPRLTRKNTNLIEITLQSTRSNKKYKKLTVTTIRCTPNHEFFLVGGAMKRADKLQLNDRLASCYQRPLNQKGYLGLFGEADSIHTSHVVLEWKNGRRPNYPKEHAHHIDENKTNNNPDNVECLSSKEHNSMRMWGDNNPSRRFPGKSRATNIRLGSSALQKNGRWRHDITTERVQELYAQNPSLNWIARQLGTNRLTIERRLNLSLNHIIKGIRYLDKKEDVYCGTVPETGKFFIWCGENEGVLVKNCSEIILRSKQTCNLSEVIARPNDTIESLATKASCAAMLGTWQATLSDYGYVGDSWKANAEEERLLGVSITGIMDSPILSNRHEEAFANAFSSMYESVTTINQAWAKCLNISRAAASTCVKPSGTVSCLVDSSSGIHSRFAPFYIRRVIMNNKDPICAFLHEYGLPNEPSEYNPNTNTVFSFPIRAPEAVHLDRSLFNRSAIEQLEHWAAVNRTWANHSVSCTIMVAEHEWPQVGGWVWEHFDELSGVSFLPKSDSMYRQMPYEEITEDQCKQLEAKMPEYIDWNELSHYEKEDTTKTGHELACNGNACELVAAE